MCVYVCLCSVNDANKIIHIHLQVSWSIKWDESSLQKKIKDTYYYSSIFVHITNTVTLFCIQKTFFSLFYSTSKNSQIYIFIPNNSRIQLRRFIHTIHQHLFVLQHSLKLVVFSSELLDSESQNIYNYYY